MLGALPGSGPDGPMILGRTDPMGMGRPVVRKRALIASAISCGLLLLMGGTPLHAQGDRDAGAGARPDRAFRAGAAASNLTPPLGEPIVGGWTSPPATHIHDE